MHALEAARKKPVTILPDHTVTEAADLMDRSAVGALVVTDADARVVGIVTDRDLVLRGLARRVSADARIDSVMSTDVVTLPADADLREALKVFEEHPIRRLPLVDGGKLVGMLTMDDLMIDLIADLTRLSRPVVGQVLFGHREPIAPATTT